MRLIILLAVSLLLVLPASAEPVGRAMVDGQVVILDSDGTWAFKNKVKNSKGKCKKITPLNICLSSIGWKNQTSPANMRYLMSKNNGRYYAGLIVEPFGKKDGYSKKFLSDAIISNAARGAKVEQDEVVILDVQEKVSGRPGFNSLTYHVVMNGTPIVFQNYYKIFPKHSVQVLFWTLGKKTNSDFKKIASEGLDNIKETE